MNPEQTPSYPDVSGRIRTYQIPKASPHRYTDACPPLNKTAPSTLRDQGIAKQESSVGNNQSTAVTFDDVMGVANKVYFRLLTQDGMQPTPSDVEEEQRAVRQVGESLLHAAGARVSHMGGSTWEGAAIEFVTMFLGYVAVSANKAENAQRVRAILAQGGPGADFVRNGFKTIDLSAAVAEAMARRGDES